MAGSVVAPAEAGVESASITVAARQLSQEEVRRLPGSTPSDAAQQASILIDEMILKQADSFTGVGIDGRNSLVVTVPRGADLNARAGSLRSALGAAGAGLSIKVAVSRHSRRVLDQLMDELKPVVDPYEDVSRFSEDTLTGVIVISFSKPNDAVKKALTGRYGDRVTFNERQRVETINREFDIAPHWGGAGIDFWNQARTTATRKSPCTAGFPIDYGGHRYMVTAGHCAPFAETKKFGWASGFGAGQAPDITYSFGETAITTFGGTVDVPADGGQDTYGDWALMDGSTYSPRIYTCGGGNTSPCASLPIGGASWVIPKKGWVVCGSGITTGLMCRMFVTSNFNVVRTVDGQWVNHLTEIVHDHDQNGTPDCAHFTNGDSGGPIFQTLSNGSVMVMGIITAQSDCEGNLYTRLTGLRAFSSSITVPNS